MIFAGTPATKQLSGISLITTALAAMITLLPILTFPLNNYPRPNKTTISNGDISAGCYVSSLGGECSEALQEMKLCVPVKTIQP